MRFTANLAYCTTSGTETIIPCEALAVVSPVHTSKKKEKKTHSGTTFATHFFLDPNNTRSVPCGFNRHSPLPVAHRFNGRRRTTFEPEPHHTRNAKILAKFPFFFSSDADDDGRWSLDLKVKMAAHTKTALASLMLFLLACLLVFAADACHSVKAVKLC